MAKRIFSLLIIVIVLLTGVIGIKPVLASATFNDVPDWHWAYDWIERLYNAGVTSGCSQSPPMYCPDQSVTRAEMAKFLLKATHGESYNPPPVGSSTGFYDVPTSYWAATWIKQLAIEGITSGCGGGNYCPNNLVTRAEMAKFLLVAKHGSGFNPPDVGWNTGFYDVPTSYWASAWIKQLAAENITSGCGGGNYCPDANVTRAEMAKFLVLTFNLPELEPTPDPTIPPADFKFISPEFVEFDVATSPILSWEMTSPVTHYEYCLSISYSCDNWVIIGVNNSVQLSDLQPDSHYYLRIRAWNGTLGPTYAKNESGLNVTSFNTAWINKSTPKNGATQVSTSVTLGWDSSFFKGSSSTDLFKTPNYEYCFDTTDDNKCDNWISTGRRYFISLSGLSEGTTYFWHVRTNNSDGLTYSDNGSSDFWSFTTGKNLPPNPILNGDFESGSMYWTVHSKNGYDIIQNLSGDIFSFPPPSGSWGVKFSVRDDEYGYIEQTVKIPLGRSFLHYWFYSWSSDPLSGYDYYFVKVGEDFVDYESLNDDNETSAWTHRVVDLSQYAGTTQTIRFLVGASFVDSSGVYLDNISLETTDY